MTDQIIIIGAGQAGAQTAQSLRQNGFEGPITLIGAEAQAPYQRPPLSKAYLKGELAEERLLLRPREFYAGQNIDLITGVAVEAIDREKKSVLLANGDSLTYDKLVIATGAPPRKLSAPGAELNGIHYLRSLTDSDALRKILSVDGQVVIVGAGYIGLEVAAVARAAGRDVIVLEMAERVLARVTSEPISAFYQNLHTDAGVDIRLGASLEGFIGDGAITGAKLTNGEVIDCAAALVGIGAIPEVGLAEAAGLELSNGIVVNEFAQTSDPSIYAAGDCTNFPSARYDRRLRLESVPNAIEQAKAVAANMLGKEIIYDPLPWFWSDQYDVKLQTVGLMQGHDSFVVRGKPENKSFAVWYLKDGAAIAVDAINDPKSFAASKKAIMTRRPLDPAQIADEAFDLKELMR